MRKRVLIVVALFSILSILGGLYIIHSLSRATTIQGNLITLHQVEILREHLLIQIKKVQGDLTLKGTRHERDIGTLTTHVENMSMVIDACFDCHHSAVTSSRLLSLHERIDAYKLALSRVFTIRANTARLEWEEDVAFSIGRSLIDDLNAMLAFTSAQLDERTQAALMQIRRSKSVLTIFILTGPLLAIGLALILFKRISDPISSLLDATRKLKSGDLDHRVRGLKDEFGELAGSFNEMAESLKEQMQSMQRAEQLVVIGEMASGLAHEIKNPLAGIKASIEILGEDLELGDQDREVLSRIIEEIKKIEALLRSLLNYARPPAPQLDTLEIERVLTRALTSARYSVRGIHSRSEKETTVSFERNFDGNLPMILADPSQLEQVFLNLLLNAAEAMPEGGAVTLSASYDIATDTVRIEVSDTGPGLEEENIEKIFKPFYTTKPRGTGLGLAICRRLINQHGGDIGVENKPGGGARFTVTIPVHHDPGEESS